MLFVTGQLRAMWGVATVSLCFSVWTAFWGRFQPKNPALGHKMGARGQPGPRTVGGQRWVH